MNFHQIEANLGSVLVAVALLWATSTGKPDTKHQTDRDIKRGATTCASDFAALLSEKAQAERLQDARAFAQEWLRSRMALCGDSSYREHHIQGPPNSWDTLTEFTGFKFWVEPETLTPADALNGVAFKGKIHINATAFRQYNSHNKKWNARSNVPFNIALPITNQQGLWTVDTAWFPFWQASNETTCNAAIKAASNQ